MYWMSPAQFHRLSPRERMVASLNGFGNSNSAVEERNRSGALVSVVPNSAPAKDMVASILTAPSITPPNAHGRFQVIEKPAAFGWRDHTITNPPQTARSSVASANYYPSSQVHRLAGFAGSGLNAAMQTREVAMTPPTALMTSRALLPQTFGPRPTYQPASASGGGAAPAAAAADPAAVVDTSSNSGAATGGQVQTQVPPAYTDPDPLDPANIEQPVQPAPPAVQPPNDVGLTQLTPLITATVTPTATSGIPLWQLGLGAAAVFGGIWYITRKG
jgi:hypothetical protein